MIEGMQISTTGQRILLGTTMVGIIPLVEELVFRGFITKFLWTHHRRRGVVWAALLFAFVHMEMGVVRNLAILALIL